MIQEYTRNFKHSLISMIQTEFVNNNTPVSIDLQTALQKYFNVHDYAKTNDIQFIDACDRYFRDIVMPHKLHVLNAGVELTKMSCFQNNYNIDKVDFMHRLFVHDMSKFSFIEASGYVHKHFDNIDFTSLEFKLAWHHHKANNDHHSQYWYDIDKQGKLSCLDMEPIAIFEMFADWIGAGKTYGESFEEWFPKNCQNLILSEKTAVTVGHIASTLLDQSMITIHRHEKIAGMYIEVN